MQISDDLPLHDIKPLVEIIDYTPFLFGAAAAVVLLLGVLVAYVLFRRLREGKRHGYRQECFDALSAVDFEQPKAAAYAISKLGRCFADDSPRLAEVYGNLYRRLEPYKFKRSVPPLDEETRAFFRIYLGMIDV